MKIFALILVVLCGGFLIYATGDFPSWGDPNSPASSYLSPYFIEKTMEDTSVPNIVTAVLADYRGYDTMFETAVIFTAGLACFILLRVFGENNPEERLFRHLPSGVVLHVTKPLAKEPDTSIFREMDPSWHPHDKIVHEISRIMIPFIQLFGLYVIAHGHHSPGGGFQGGVILGASIILLAIGYDLRTSCRRVPENIGAILSAMGVLIYAGVGEACVFMGANFLDYSALAPILGVDPIYARSLGILFVETGVGLAVLATMVVIYNHLASAGRFDQGL